MELSRQTGGRVARIDGNTLVYPSRAAYFIHGPLHMLIGGFLMGFAWHLRNKGDLPFLLLSIAIGAFGTMNFLSGFAGLRVALRRSPEIVFTEGGIITFIFTGQPIFVAAEDVEKLTVHHLTELVVLRLWVRDFEAFKRRLGFMDRLANRYDRLFLPAHASHGLHLAWNEMAPLINELRDRFGDRLVLEIPAAAVAELSGARELALVA